MAIRVTWMVAAVVGAAALVAVVRGCNDGGDRTPADVSEPASVLQSRNAGDASAQDASKAALAATAQQRHAALQSAVDTLHRYLAALAAADRTTADAGWAGGRVPARSGEADLRTLQGLHTLRIENGTPVALDSAVVPTALEIPVRLRVSRQGAPLKLYAGWYRMRRAISGDGWEITSASIDALPPQR